jgi:hypothetical protein
MTRNVIEPMPLLFLHEATELFTSVRELHLYGVSLERTVGATRAITQLTTAAFHALSNIAAAGVAPSERAQNMYLERVRRQLARCAMVVVALRDRDVIDRDLTLYGLRLVDRSLDGADGFRVELAKRASATTSAEPRQPRPEGVPDASAPPAQASPPQAPPRARTAETSAPPAASPRIRVVHAQQANDAVPVDDRGAPAPAQRPTPERAAAPKRGNPPPSRGS